MGNLYCGCKPRNSLLSGRARQGRALFQQKKMPDRIPFGIITLSMDKKDIKKNNKPSLFALLKPYWKLVIPLVLLALASNGLTLWLPRLLSHGIDGFLKGRALNTILWQFAI